MINTIPFNRNGMSMMMMNYYTHFNHDLVQCDFVVNKYIEDDYKKTIVEHGGKIYIFSNRNAQPIKYIKWLSNIIGQNKYDIVYVHGNSATMSAELYAARKYGVITIVHAHNVKTEHPVLHELLYPYFIKHYDYAFAAGTEAGKWLYRGRPFYVIKNGIDSSLFEFSQGNRDRVRKMLGISNESKVLIQVGSFTEQKNYLFTMKLIKEMKDRRKNIHLIAVGVGPLLERMKTYCKQNGIQEYVHFVGSKRNTGEYYSAADQFIFPSLYESFGIVVAEAQANGLSCVVSEAVPKAINVTGTVKFEPLDIDVWVQNISNQGINVRTNFNSEQTRQLFLSKNLSIDDDALKMQSLFEAIVKGKDIYR